MPQMQIGQSGLQGEASCLCVQPLTLSSPLKPDELQVLRAQYEKEGEYVGVQTKFNYAWVRLPHSDWSTIG